MNIKSGANSEEDLPLTEKGIKQSEALRDYFQDIMFDHIFSSPMLRAKQTTEIICGEERSFEIYDALHEISLGKLGNMTWQQRQKLYPGVDLSAALSKVNSPDGESFEKVLRRCNDFIKNKLELRGMGENILVVCHGVVKRVLINSLLEKPSHYVDYINWADNTAVTEIDWKNKKLLKLNDRKHLTDTGLSNPEKWINFSERDYTQL